MLAKRTKRCAANPNNNSYWMSYSDMMAALLLMFILLLFLSFNRYLSLQETKQAELADAILGELTDEEHDVFRRGRRLTQRGPRWESS